jgi:hypothetical protein
LFLFSKSISLCFALFIIIHCFGKMVKVIAVTVLHIACLANRQHTGYVN